MNQQTITDLNKLAGSFEVVAGRFPLNQVEPNSHRFFTKAATKAEELAAWYAFPSADLTRHQELKEIVEDLAEVCEVLAEDNSLTPHGRQFWEHRVAVLTKLSNWHAAQIRRTRSLDAKPGARALVQAPQPT